MAAQDYVSVVQQLYISYFGRPADFYGLKNYTERLEALKAPTDFAALNALVQADKAGTTELSKLVNSFNTSPEAIALYGTDNSNLGISKFLVAVFENVLGRTPELGPGWDFWFNALASGNLRRADAAMAITEGALSNTTPQGLIDAALVQKKNAVSVAFTNALDTPQKINAYSTKAAIDVAVGLLEGVTATTDVAAYQPTIVAAVDAVVITSIPLVTTNLGLTADTVNGSVGNDVINGTLNSDTTKSTLNGLDIIKGNAGNDTLNILIENTGASLPGVLQMTGVETINVRSAAEATIDLTTAAGISGVTDLNVTQSAAATLEAGSSTNITVSGATDDIAINGGANIKVTDATANTDIIIGKSAAGAGSAGTVSVTDSAVGTGSIAVDGGTDVTVSAANVAGTGTIKVGLDGTTATPTGAIKVTSTGAAYDATAGNTLSAISVKGGSSITVTQVATSDASAAASDTTPATITQGNIAITADTKTTTVTVKQDAASAGSAAAATTGGVTETASVKFSALAATKTISLGGLTLTAVTNMTAAEVAAAFANLASTAAKPTDIAPGTPATGDTQSGAAHGKGIYSGSMNAWTSGAATGDTVVFTYTANTALVGTLTDGGDGAATTITPLTDGKAHDATIVGGSAVVVAGDVSIAGAAALATVTVDGYAATSAITGGTNSALATVNLSNGGNFAIASAASTLGLKLVNVSGTVDVAAGTTVLNANVSGTGTAALKSASATTVNVSGTGKVSGTTGVGGLTAATAITTTGMTAGTATFTIADGTATSYAGGAATDILTITNGGTAVTKSIDLGAGDDTLVLTGAPAVVPTATLKGGAGTDSISISVASAVSLGGNTNFAGKLDSFERLVLNDNGTGTVNLENLGFTNYVTTSGTTGLLTVNNLANNGTVVVTADATTGYTVGVKDAATGAADVANIKFSSAGAVDAKVVTITDVETVNIEAIDTNATAHADSLTLTANAATKLVISGNAGVTLTALTGSDVLASINASTATGALTATASGAVAMTITGGSGADVLAASTGSTAKADVLVGGAGNDKLIVGSNGATLTGGLGNDTFVVTATSALTGSKEANTYSTITDFAAGDLLQLQYWNTAGTAKADVLSFTKLTASLNPETATFSNYVQAAMQQLDAIAGPTGGLGHSVWFTLNGNSYVVVDSGADSDANFVNGADMVVRLNGVDLSNASWNSTFATVSL